MEIYNVGMYGGSFDPLHIGHINDMIKAASMCKELNIIISYNEKRDFIPKEIKYRWINNCLKHIGNVKIHLLKDDAKSKDEYNQSDYWQKGCTEIKNLINKKIDIVFCGSDYKGTNRFESLYKESIIHYFDRNEINISSTEIRKDVFKYWNYIPNTCKPYFVKKILIIGSESCGKSVLTQNLALAYNTNFLNEVGRDVCENVGNEDTMVAEDFHEILIKHKAKEYEVIKYSNKLLFIDTDALITKFFSQFLLTEEKTINICNKLADSISNINNFDLILFLEPDIPFVQDGTRSEEIKENREFYSKQIKKIYKEKNIDFICLTGTYFEKFEKAKKIINDKFNID